MKEEQQHPEGTIVITVVDQLLRPIPGGEFTSMDDKVFHKAEAFAKEYALDTGRCAIGYRVAGFHSEGYWGPNGVKRDKHWYRGESREKGSAQSVYLNAEDVRQLRLMGGGNMSEGVRVGIKLWAQQQTLAAPLPTPAPQVSQYTTAGDDDPNNLTPQELAYFGIK